MNKTIVNLVIVTALSFSGAASAADETGREEQPPAPASASAPETVAPAVATEASPPAAEPEPAVKRPSRKRAKVRPKDMDLRHCLELSTNAAIARCAHE